MRCGFEFSDWTNRWIGQLRISAKQWLCLVKLFKLEVSPLKAARQMVLSCPTVLKAFHLIRKCILATTEDGEPLLRGEGEADECCFGGMRKGPRGRGASAKVPGFVILQRRGIVKVEVVPNVTAETLLNLTVKIVRRASIVYSGIFKSCDALMFCGYRHLKTHHGELFTRGKVYINGLEGFCSCAKERLIKHHGVSKEYFSFI